MAWALSLLMLPCLGNKTKKMTLKERIQQKISVIKKKLIKITENQRLVFHDL